MSAEYRFFWASTFLNNAKVQNFGSLDEEVKAVTINATGTLKPGVDYTVPAGGSVTVYDYDTEGAWDFFVAQVLNGEGFLYWTADRDSPTSTSDLSASGSHPDTTPKMGLSCDAPLVFCSRHCLVNSNAADGYIYGLKFYNAGTADVILRVWSH